MTNESGNNELLTLTQVARSIPGRPHGSTIFRWCRRGVRGVRLGYVRFGRRMLVPRTALEAFGKQLAELDHAEDERRAAECHRPSTPPTRTDKQRAKAIERAENELKNAGV